MTRLYHVVDKRDISHLPKKEKLRIEDAQRSWARLYEQHGVIPVHVSLGGCERSATDIGDSRALPYLKDVLQKGMDAMKDESDILAWTNDDVWIHPEIADLLRFHVSIYDVCTSRRCEVESLLPDDATPEDYKAVHGGHLGRDLFACTKRWLLDHWNDIPDFFTASSKFDLALAYLVRNYHGHTLQTIQSLDAQAWPAEIEIGYLAHVRHQSHWSQNPDSPAEQHNAVLFTEFAKGLK